jgi:hypothetical protein
MLALSGMRDGTDPDTVQALLTERFPGARDD